MKPRYKLLKGLWKGVRTVTIVAGTYLVANYQEWAPPEALTPLGIAIIEVLRNRLFGEHSRRIIG